MHSFLLSNCWTRIGRILRSKCWPWLAGFLCRLFKFLLIWKWSRCPSCIWKRELRGGWKWDVLSECVSWIGRFARRFGTLAFHNQRLVLSFLDLVDWKCVSILCRVWGRFDHPYHPPVICYPDFHVYHSSFSVGFVRWDLMGWFGGWDCQFSSNFFFKKTSPILNSNIEVLGGSRCEPIYFAWIFKATG